MTDEPKRFFRFQLPQDPSDEDLSEIVRAIREFFAEYDRKKAEKDRYKPEPAKDEQR